MSATVLNPFDLRNSLVFFPTPGMTSIGNGARNDCSSPCGIVMTPFGLTVFAEIFETSLLAEREIVQGRERLA